MKTKTRDINHANTEPSSRKFLCGHEHTWRTLGDVSTHRIEKYPCGFCDPAAFIAGDEKHANAIGRA